MTHETDIIFRGMERTVEFEHEGDGVILWWFPDDKDHADSQGGASRLEQDSIYEELWAYLLDFWAGGPGDE